MVESRRWPIIAVVLCLVCLVRASAGPDLKSLYDAHQWFKLRDAVGAASAAPFYRGAAASAFNDNARAEKYLRQVIGSSGSEGVNEARGLLIYMHQRAGRYRQALDQIEKLQAAAPNASGLANAHALFGALSQYPEQSIVERRESRVAWTINQGNLFIPVSINGISATHIVDTGANFSTVSESEAARLGLRVSAATATGSGSTGATIGLRVAVADTLAIGRIRLRHVVFLVAPDDAQPFADLPAGERGVLGLPVLLALETMRWRQDGTFEAAFGSDGSNVGRANLCFDGAMPVVQATFEQHAVDLVLDTGATKSDLWPPFARQFATIVNAGTRETRRVTGVGHSQEFEGVTLPSVEMRLGGMPLLLRPAHVLLEQTDSESRWFHGRLGFDLLRQAHAVTLDFRAMTLKLDRGDPQGRALLGTAGSRLASTW